MTRLLQRRNIDPNEYDNEFQRSPLMETISGYERHPFREHVESPLKIVECLFLHPMINVNWVDCDGRSALVYAILEGDLDVVKALLKHPTNINPLDKMGESALTCAAFDRGGDQNPEIVHALLEYPGLDINQKTGKDGITFLMRAAEAGDWKIAGLAMHMLGPKINLNLRDRLNRTALSIAASEGRAVFVQWLLTYRAVQVKGDVNPGTQNDDDERPWQFVLHEVARYGQVGVLEAFSADKFRRTELEDFEVKDEEGLTPLFWAINTGMEKVVEFLLGKHRILTSKTIYEFDQMHRRDGSG
jgi:ankyrin repeat protein